MRTFIFRKFFILASALVFSSVSLAAQKSANYQVTLTTDTFASAAEAVGAGKDLMDELNTATPFELSRELPHFRSTTHYASFQLTDSMMSVKSVVDKEGNIEYLAGVRVDYRYSYKT